MRGVVLLLLTAWLASVTTGLERKVRTTHHKEGVVVEEFDVGVEEGHDYIFNRKRGFNDGNSRDKRDEEPLILGLTQHEHDRSLAEHNHWRRQIPSSNMEKLRYNMVLGEMVYNLTESCNMHHWWPRTWPNQPFEYDYLGQNLFATNGQWNLSSGITGWWEEKDNFDYETNSCMRDQCGHYTQLMWATTTLVGCAHTFCPDFITPWGSFEHNYHFYGCNYGTAGNVNTYIPFLLGPACSECDTGYFWCDTEEPRGLCNSEYNGTTTVPDDVVCAAADGCKNGAVGKCDCTCQCNAGYSGKFCEKECFNHHPYCGNLYPQYYCTVPSDYRATVHIICPDMCGLCGTEDPKGCDFDSSSNAVSK